MLRDRLPANKQSEFMNYLAKNCHESNDRLPPLTELSSELGISVASLREQLEVARAMGIVEVRPKTGIRRLPYTFGPAVEASVVYATTVSPELFKAYSDLRSHLEAAYWYQAVSLLTAGDCQHLRDLVKLAQAKLHAPTIQIPHAEHRELHLCVYSRVDNPFVQGILEAYWNIYEAFGLNVYTDLSYHEKVWQYHHRMVEAVCMGDFSAGYKALTEHMDLISQRSKPAPSQKFE
jgi:DNA-binding FadR family transcriptional regulator